MENLGFLMLRIVFLLEPIVTSLIISLEIGRELLVLFLQLEGHIWLTVAPSSGLWFDVMSSKGGGRRRTKLSWAPGARTTKGRSRGVPCD